MAIKNKCVILLLGILIFSTSILSIIPISVLSFPTQYPIYINSPEAIIYTNSMPGYYAGTYGFENETQGSKPKHWTENSPGNARAYVMDEVSGIKKCLRFYDPWQWWFYPTYVEMSTSFTYQIVGTVEFKINLPTESN